MGKLRNNLYWVDFRVGNISEPNTANVATVNQNPPMPPTPSPAPENNTATQVFTSALNSPMGYGSAASRTASTPISTPRDASGNIIIKTAQRATPEQTYAYLHKNDVKPIIPIVPIPVFTGGGGGGGSTTATQPTNTKVPIYKKSWFWVAVVIVVLVVIFRKKLFKTS